MSHVDEGQLNAYLDGQLEPDVVALVEAHLESCHACQAHLAEERQVRARAEAILGGAAPPAVTPPPFEELRDRRRGQSTRHPALFARLQPIAWAATIMVAVAIGWYVRGERLPEGEPAAMAVTADSGTPTIALAEREQETDALTSRREAPAEQQPSARATRPATVQDSFGAAQAETPERERRLSEDPRPIMVQAGRADTTVSSPTSGALELAPSEPAERKSVMDQVSIATPLADSDLAITGLRSDWVTADERSARAFFGRPIVVIEGLAVISYEIRRVGGSQSLVRVTHRLASGDAVQLVQQFNAEARGDEARAERLGRNALESRQGTAALTEVRGDYLITLRGPVSADSLRALFKRVR